MIRFIRLSGIVLAATAIASAAQIQIGSGGSGIVNGVSVTSVDGLTSSYVSSPGNATLKNYDVDLFAGASNSSLTPTTPKPYSTYSTTAANEGTITDSSADAGNGVVFSMIDSGLDVGNNSNNVWMLPATGNTTLTIPVGIFGISDVWTLLSAYNAITAARDENITFVFKNASNVATNVTFKLSNAGTSPPPAGQIENGLDCATGCPAGLSNGPALASSALTSTAGGYTLTEFTDSIPTTAFDFNSGGVGSTGTAELSDQGFVFTGNLLGLAASETLDSIMIQEKGGTSGETGSGLGLSAATLDTTPEPSTVFLLLGGAGLLGLSRLRRTGTAK